MATLQYVQNDTAPDINFTVTRNGAVVDLTGATVKFKIANSDTLARTNDAHNSCTLIVPAAGTCSYSFVSGDLPLAATYNCDLEITFASGKIETYPKPIIIVARAEA